MVNDSPWGMCNHYPDERLINLLAAGGVKWIRTGVSFDVQPPQFMTQPVWAAIDSVAAIAARNGQQLYFGLGPYYPLWMIGGDPPRLEAWNNRYVHWENFVRMAVKRFGDLGVRYFNIGNEPNDPYFYPFGWEEFMNQFVIAAKVICGAGYYVCGPDITSAAHRPFDFLRLFLQRLAQESIRLDVATIHGYPSGGDPTSKLIVDLYKIEPVLREFGLNVPVWVTETGTSNTRAEAAQNGQRVTEICSWIGDGPIPYPRHPGEIHNRPPKLFKKVFFFVWSDDPKYGWLDSSLNPRPLLWDAYTNYIRTH